MIDIESKIKEISETGLIVRYSESVVRALDTLPNVSEGEKHVILALSYNAFVRRAETIAGLPQMNNVDVAQKDRIMGIVLKIAQEGKL